jgi:hypothetical protein
MDYRTKLYSLFESKVKGNVTQTKTEPSEPVILQLTDRISLSDIKVKLSKAKKSMDKKD